MPELPEVETIRRQLEPLVRGRRLEAVEVLDPLWAVPASPAEVDATCAGRRIEGIGRRGKYLVFELEGGRRLVLHLRMTGRLLAGGGPPPRHLRARLLVEGGPELRFADPRRFGRGLAFESPEPAGAYLAERLGVEPLSGELTAATLAALAAGRRTPLKSFLLDQRRVAGLGNIYADEALFRAGLHPLSPAGSMRAEHCERLRAGIVAALEAGLAGGGASIGDYLDARGERGSMQDELLVHRREGLPCPACGGPIRRIRLAGRSTYFCPACQRRLRRRPRRRAAARARRPTA